MHVLIITLVVLVAVLVLFAAMSARIVTMPIQSQGITTRADQQARCDNAERRNLKPPEMSGALRFACPTARLGSLR
jgi:hypothetical protein